MADSSTIGCNFLLYETTGVITMLVRMKQNLIVRYQLCPEFNYSKRYSHYSAPNELIAIKDAHGIGAYFKTKMFLKSIEGKIVELVFYYHKVSIDKLQQHYEKVQMKKHE